MRDRTIGATLLLAVAPVAAAAQVGVEAGRTLRTELHAIVHVDWPDPPGGSESSGLDLRRARIGLTGAAFERIEYQVERDFRERARPWRDVYGNVALSRALEIRAGRFKVPFSLDQLTSVGELDLVARSLAAQYLAPGRDTGLMAHGRLFGPRLRFQTGVFRAGGDAIRAAERRDPRHGALAAGRLVVRLHRGLSAAVAATAGQVPEGEYSLRGHTAVDVPFFPVVAVSGVRRRYGGEVEWRAGPVAAAAEVIRVTDERRGQSVDDETLPPLVAQGWYVRGTWLVTGERKTDRVRPSRAFLRGGAGAIEIAVRLEDLELRSRRAGGTSAGGTRTETLPAAGDRAATLGVNWYLNRFVRLQANAVRDWLRDGGAPPRAAPRRWNPAVRLQFVL